MSGISGISRISRISRTSRMSGMSRLRRAPVAPGLDAAVPQGVGRCTIAGRDAAVRRTICFSRISGAGSLQGRGGARHAGVAAAFSKISRMSRATGARGAGG
jgi:hypothetical protein